MTHPTLDTALTYADQEWRVIPILPGEKRPALAAWQDAATTDPGLIEDWFTRWPDHGVGIACGEASGIFVLDVDNSGGKVGDRTLAQLEAKYGPLPETYTVRTGSGGWHFYFRFDPTRPVRNGILGEHLDIRGEGGQVLAPPTLHPKTGEPYVVHLDVPVADAPDWVYDIIFAPAPDPTPAPAQPAAVQGEDGPAQRYNEATTWEELLVADGWTLHHVDAKGEVHWTRPGKDRRDGTSATTNYDGRDCLKVFTSSVPGLEADRAYSRFGYYAATRHGGDRSAAAAQLRADGYAPPPFDPVGWIADAARDIRAGEAPASTIDGEDPHGWESIDLDDVLSADYVPPQPDLLFRSDGRALLYRGRINALIGESGSGKSWVSQAAIAQALRTGGTAVVVDLEDHKGSYVARLRALGVTAEEIRTRLRYISPEQALSPRAAAYLAELVLTTDVALVVIDSTGESMALQGIKPNDDDDVARWFRLLPRAVAGLGPAVLLLDHLPKASDAPTGFAIGSQRKRAAIDGAMYRVEVGVAPVKGKTGRLRLVCAKDRAGNWQHGTNVAEVVIVDQPDGTRVSLGVPGDPARPTVLMARVSEYLGKAGPCSRTQIAAELKGKRDYLYKAIDVLIAEGYAAEHRRSGRGGGLEIVSVKAFRDDPVADWMDSIGRTPPTPPNPEPVEKTGFPTIKNPNPANPAPHTYVMGAGDRVRFDRDGTAENEPRPDGGTGFVADDEPDDEAGEYTAIVAEDPPEFELF